MSHFTQRRFPFCIMWRGSSWSSFSALIYDVANSISQWSTLPGQRLVTVARLWSTTLQENWSNGVSTGTFEETSFDCGGSTFDTPNCVSSVIFVYAWRRWAFGCDCPTVVCQPGVCQPAVCQPAVCQPDVCQLSGSKSKTNTSWIQISS